MIRALDITALRQALNVSRATIERWTKRSDPVKRLHRLTGTGRFLVPETELERWLRQNTYPTP